MNYPVTVGLAVRLLSMMRSVDQDVTLDAVLTGGGRELDDSRVGVWIRGREQWSHSTVKPWRPGLGWARHNMYIN
jgi:hypothetical protein